MDKEELFEKIIRILRSKGAKKIAVFGSYARGEETPESDIDIIVEFSERKSLLELIRIERELSEDIGIKVDLLTKKAISPYLVDRITKEMKVIYE
ncbi:MAG: nucleotidyltransferase family protein [Thermoproteota archaeon]|jgi:predicted nucleotidyltransferase